MVDYGLNNRVAIITGANNPWGIGAATALAFAREGAKVVFDPTLVRGMGYYTGTIFEVKLDEYNFSIAGGGRYDEMMRDFHAYVTGEKQNPFTYEHDYLVQKVLDEIVGGVRINGKDID